MGCRKWASISGKDGFTIEHHGAALRHGAHVASLLFQFPDSSLLGRLAGVDEACGYFDDDLVEGRAVLLLEEYLGAWCGGCWVCGLKGGEVWGVSVYLLISLRLLLFPRRLCLSLLVECSVRHVPMFLSDRWGLGRLIWGF
jgi:hypothetical protein